MAYNEFAYFYDEFNTAADYDALYRYVTGELAAHGVPGGLLADLGCGTGDLTLMLAQAGYDVIGVDQSEEMLSVLREKADELGLAGQTFDLDAGDACCRWSNTYDPQAGRVRIDICITDRETGGHWQELFYEYSYDLDTVQTLLDRYGYTVARVADGEDFGPLRPDSQRWIFTAVKRYTQQGPKGETE